MKLDMDAMIREIGDIESVQIMYMDGDMSRYDGVKSFDVDLENNLLIMDIDGLVVYNLSNIVGFFVVPKAKHEDTSDEDNIVKLK